MAAEYSENEPLSKSPWSSHLTAASASVSSSRTKDESVSAILLGSLIREEGHIYSLASRDGLLYTGSDSKNIRVWKNQKEHAVFKSHSGLVKAIIIAGREILTGHQDGRIRVWKVSEKNNTAYRRVATLPTLKNYIKCSIRPKNYVEGRRNRSVLWIKHHDAISCLGLTKDASLIYSASWDKTFKVWKASNFKCLESVTAHDDAVNALVVGTDGLVFTGSADGTVKVWRREVQGKGTKHFFSQTLLKQECAVTALALSPDSSYLYCGSSDGVVNYWEQGKPESHGGFVRGHKLAVLCLVTVGNLLMSGSADMAICVWKRLENGEHRFASILTSHTGPVKCLSVEKDPEATKGEQQWILYSGSLDKSVKKWKVSDTPPATAHNQQHRRSVDTCYPTAVSIRKMGSRTVI
ncbi:hypothetical protein QN277_027820 [Acacia crassicarpa]|uniref:Uncharacterized protein n=1 Tax=Acacia crassicarpa TaxID=499986 RepID=A0AAE1MHM0_9FABA|nr:hypothetical protein QN277_027820 [Acacia crassicarpa]